MSLISQYFQRYSLLFALLLFWFFSTTFNWVSPTLLASPIEVLSRLSVSFSPETPKIDRIHLHAWETIYRALEGWFVAAVIGVIGGSIAAIRFVIFSMTEIVTELFRSVPPILAFPLALVAFDYGEAAYVTTIAFGCVPVMLLTVSRGFLSTSVARLQILRTYETPLFNRLFLRTIDILPSVFLGLRLTFNIALTIAVVTEMVFTPRNGFSLGALARDSEINFDTPTFYACVVIMGIFGYLVNVLLQNAQQRFELAR